jgi:SAM-dependent methyltransferase
VFVSKFIHRKYPFFVTKIKDMEQPDFKHIAAQLRQPSGKDGLETAERMSMNNGNMIRRCIDLLQLKDGNQVLEIGPGGGLHIPYFFEKEKNLHYTGVDISDTMIALASENNAALVKDGMATFTQLNIENGFAALPYPDQSFDVIFTVNTLYFWDDAPAQAKEILRVLKPGGRLSVCFATDEFMRMLPFTQYGFHLYSIEKATGLMTEAGFTITGIQREKEMVRIGADENMEREFVVLTVCR